MNPLSHRLAPLTLAVYHKLGLSLIYLPFTYTVWHVHFKLPGPYTTSYVPHIWTFFLKITSTSGSAEFMFGSDDITDVLWIPSQGKFKAEGAGGT